MQHKEKLKIEYRNSYYTDDEQILIDLLSNKQGLNIELTKKEIQEALGYTEISDREVNRMMTSFLYEIKPMSVNGVDMGETRYEHNEGNYYIKFTNFGKYALLALNELCKENVVSNLPDIKKDTSNIGKDKVGYYVYKLYEDDELIYIGQSRKPIQRILNHVNGELNKNINYVGVTELKSETEMTALEMLLISKYQPKNNTQHRKDVMNIPFEEPKFIIMPLREFLEGKWVYQKKPNAKIPDLSVGSTSKNRN